MKHSGISYHFDNFSNIKMGHADFQYLMQSPPHPLRYLLSMIEMKGILHHRFEQSSFSISFAERARKDGLLALEEEIEAIDDPFMRKGMQLIVDGTDPDLCARSSTPRSTHGRAPQARRRVFEKAGGFAPTIGVLGTVVSLVHVLANLERARDARPRDLRRVHRDALRRRLGERRLPARLLLAADAQPEGGRRAHPDRSRASSPSRPATTRAWSQQKLLSFLAPAERERSRPAAPSRRSRPSPTRGPGRVGQPWPPTRQEEEARRRPRRAPDERWLVTYADLMTLLVALFMVLFSISSVNKSKFETLQDSLQDAFSGQDPAGRPVDQGGRRLPTTSRRRPRRRPSPACSPTSARPRTRDQGRAAPTNEEQEQFQKLKQQIDDVAAKKSLRARCKRRSPSDGLRDPAADRRPALRQRLGRARPASLPLLDKMSPTCWPRQADHQLIVAGNTDNAADPQRAVPDNLDALDGPRRRDLAHLRARRHLAAAHDGRRPRRATARRAQQDRRRPHHSTAASRSSCRAYGRTALAAPPARRTKIPSIKPNFTHDAMKTSKLKFIIPVLLLVLGGVYKFVLAKPAPAPKPKIAGRGVHHAQGLPDQPQGRALRQAQRRAGAQAGYLAAVAAAGGGHEAAAPPDGLRHAARRRPSCARSSPTRSPTCPRARLQQARSRGSRCRSHSSSASTRDRCQGRGRPVHRHRDPVSPQPTTRSRTHDRRRVHPPGADAAPPRRRPRRRRRPHAA